MKSSRYFHHYDLWNNIVSECMALGTYKFKGKIILIKLLLGRHSSFLSDISYLIQCSR